VVSTPPKSQITASTIYSLPMRSDGFTSVTGTHCR